MVHTIGYFNFINANKETNFRRDAQSSYESDKLSSSTQPDGVSTTKSPERKIRAAQDVKMGQQSVPTKPTTETPEGQKPVDVK